MKNAENKTKSTQKLAPKRLPDWYILAYLEKYERLDLELTENMFSEQFCGVYFT